MIPLLLAQTDGAGIGLVVQAASAVATLGLTLLLLFRGASGRDTQRQIEPTEMHGIATELRAQTATLTKLDREMGGVKESIRAVDAKIDAQSEQTDKAFQRINAISIESAKTSARVDGLEKRETPRHA